MVEYRCYIDGCDFITVNNPHVDACLSILQEHFRAVHPRLYLSPRDAGMQIARFNLTFEEYMVNNLGVEWARFPGDTLYYARGIVTNHAADKCVNCQSTVDAAQAWIDANAANANAQDDVEAEDADPFDLGPELAEVELDDDPLGFVPIAAPEGNEARLMDVGIPVQHFVRQNLPPDGADGVAGV